MQHITKQHPSLSIVRQCTLLSLNRSSLYYKPSSPATDTVTLMNELRDLHERYPMYGYRKAHALLHRHGWRVNMKLVYRLWVKMGFSALYTKKRTTVAAKGRQKYPYLLNDLAITHANHVWQTDITYIKLAGGYVYLIALIDVYSRYVLGWTLSNSMDTGFCLRAFDMATELEVYPEIINTDQGSQFTSDDWLYALRNCSISVSMTGKGRCIDNIYIERFWRTVKYEEVYLKSYDTIAEAKVAIKSFIDFYNHERPHQSLGYRTPADYYLGIASHGSRPDGYVENSDKFTTYPQAQQQQLMFNICNENNGRFVS